MTLDTLTAAMKWVRSSCRVGARLSIVWHAGEPTVVSKAWYEAAFQIIASELPDIVLGHHFQTNAVLLDSDWCDFFLKHRVSVGVSIDGPADVHDESRTDRKGRGTHARAICGIQRLATAGVRFHVISVITRAALDDPKRVVDFLFGLGAEEYGFNVEEVEGVHRASTLDVEGACQALTRFWECVLDAAEKRPIRVREIERVLSALRSPHFGRLAGNQENQAGRIVSIGTNGDYSFWSPEVFGALHPEWGRMVLGNFSHKEAADVGARRIAGIQKEIDRGILSCKASCKYFDFCLGGAPSNKLFEKGSFDTGETNACRWSQKIVIDAVLARLDRRLPQ